MGAGRGFTFEELKEAGIPKKLAPTIGICVDHRRRNKSLESLQANVQRLKAYKAKLVLFPRNAKKSKAGDSFAADLATADQLKGKLLPIASNTAAGKPEFVSISDAQKKKAVYHTFRTERMNQRLFGLRKKKREEAEAEEKEKAK